MKALRPLLILSVSLLAVGCSSISVTQDYDSEADFQSYYTFDWVPRPTTDVSANAQQAMQHNTLLDGRIKKAVNTQLTAKGMTQTPNSPDILLVYHVGSQDKINVTDWGYSYGGYWGYGGRNVDVYSYTQGTLIVDLIDASTKKLVWRGTATGTIDPGASSEQRVRTINEAVSKMLKKYPPKT